MELENLASVLMTHVPVPVLVLDEDLTVVQCNASFLVENSLREDDIRCRSFPELATSKWGFCDLTPQLQALIARTPSSIELEQGPSESVSQFVRITATSVSAGSRRALLLAFEDQLARRFLSIQDEERRRVAMEVHDGIGQEIGLLHLDLTKLTCSIPPGARALRAQSKKIATRVSRLADDVRRLAHELHPSVLEDIGLPAALRYLARDFDARYGIPVHLRIQISGASLSKEIASNLYRIAQEALRNVARHAGKTEVIICLTRTSDVLTMSIQDFGRGFSTVRKKGFHLGLITMKERAHFIRGRFEIFSVPGEGTTISVQVPISSEDA